MTPRTILLVGTLDTKGPEYAFVRDAVRARGHRTMLVDIGVLGDPFVMPDVSADDVARAAGTDLASLRTRADRGHAVDAMQRGAAALLPAWYAAGRFDGAIGLGGGGGTTMIATAMRTLPVGVPKVIVSTMGAGDTSPYVGVKDLTLMYSVVDIAGLNPLSRRILGNAAGAICGMVEALDADDGDPGAHDARPLVAATMFGVTTPCVTAVRAAMDDAGVDTIVFHATGSGGRAMEGLIDDGFFAGVIDVTTTEWCDEVVGGVLTAGPTRLSAAGRRGIPQVVSVGALDMVNFGGIDAVPERFRSRTLYRHNDTVTLMRTTADECVAIAHRIAAQLNAATGPTAVVLPLRGVSAIDAPGQPFHDPAADAALFDTLRTSLDPRITLVDVDAHINDAAFANALVDTYRSLARHMP
ncbi:MAG: Tm-1-like ATP-binding domain-containing protein [Acidobacteria bacterium]|nr:Tm-1-like ATP-binding domain-containing protein [Acidobacteriota bacterium]